MFDYFHLHHWNIEAKGMFGEGEDIVDLDSVIFSTVWKIKISNLYLVIRTPFNLEYN